MIFDLLFFVIGSILDWAAIFAPSWSLYSDDFLAAVQSAGQGIGKLDFICFGLAGEILVFLGTLFMFEAALFTWEKIQSLLNYLRGSGSLNI